MIPKSDEICRDGTLDLYTFIHKDYVTVPTGGYNLFDSQPPEKRWNDEEHTIQRRCLKALSDFPALTQEVFAYVVHSENACYDEYMYLRPYLRPLIGVIVGTGLFAVLTYYAQPLAAEPPNFRLIILIGLGGALAIGAVAVIIAGHQHWWWLGGLLSPFSGTVLYLAVFVAPPGGEQGADAASPVVVIVTCLQFLPTALAGALAAGYVLGRGVRTQSPMAPPDSSEGRLR